MTLNLDFKKAERLILDEVEERAPIVGGFIVHDARKRLQAIQEPKFGRKYRRIIVAGLLAFFVERTSSEVVIFVGVKKTKESEHHGFYIEIGSKTAKAQPFLRPAVFDNAKRIVELITK